MDQQRASSFPQTLAARGLFEDSSDIRVRIGRLLGGAGFAWSLVHVNSSRRLIMLPV